MIEQVRPMPEMPEVQAHAERLTEQFGGLRLKQFRPFTFTALKTVVPAPEEAYGQPLQVVGRRGKFLLLEFEPVTFVVHLMQGGRLLVDEKKSAKPRAGQARFVFERPPGATDPPALLLTEQGTERKAGVWCVPTEKALSSEPLDTLGPEAAIDLGGRVGRPVRRAAEHPAALVPPRPARRRRTRPAAGQRGLPSRQALAVRDDAQARCRRRRGRRRGDP